MVQYYSVHNRNYICDFIGNSWVNVKYMSQELLKNTCIKKSAADYDNEKIKLWT